MKRLIEKMVWRGLVTACRLATWPTRRSPSFVKPTTDGVVRPPSALGMTTGSPPSMTATTELVVPRSMPMTLSAIYQISDWRIGGLADFASRVPLVITRFTTARTGRGFCATLAGFGALNQWVSGLRTPLWTPARFFRRSVHPPIRQSVDPRFRRESDNPHPGRHLGDSRADVRRLVRRGGGRAQPIP